MYLTTDEAIKILKTENIITNRQTLLRFIREGKIKAKKRSNKYGYRIEEKSLRAFIEQNKEEEGKSIFDVLDGLKKENEKLKEERDDLLFKIKTPDTIIQAENLRLVEKNKDLEEEIKRLKEKLEKMKEEQITRVQVE